MKNYYIFSALAASLVFASCADDYDRTVLVEKPESVKSAEQIASLNVLNSYIDKSKNPNFKLGVAVAAADYAAHELTYSIAKSNFDLVVDPDALSHCNIVADDGKVSTTKIASMFLDDAPAVVAGPMYVYNAVNFTQLNSVVAPNFVLGDLASGTLTLFDFDSDPLGTQYEMSNGSIATVVEDPKGDSGNVLQVGSPDNKAKNSYAVLNVDLPNNLTIGNLLSVKYDIYCVDNNSLKKNLVLIVNNKRKNFTSITPDKLGLSLENWGRRVIEHSLSEVDKLEEPDFLLSSFPLSVGPNVLNSYYYIDNVAVDWQTGEPSKYVDKTDEEKCAALENNFSELANSVMEVAAPYISDYVVVANPMSDDDNYMLRSAISESDLGNDISQSFFLNDYMGDNYVKSLTASMQSAYTANGGKDDLKLYVSESGLLGNPGKTARFVSQVAKWSNAGAKIDGVAVDLKLVYSDVAAQQAADRQAVSDLFAALASTGKLVRLDNVSMTNANADFYGFVMEQYFAKVPAAQRAGVIFASTSELWKNATRTPVYEAIVNSFSKQ